MRLFAHQMRVSWKLGFLACLGLFVFQLLIVRVFVTFSADPQQALLIRAMPRWAQNFFGLDELPINSLSGFLAIGYQHPFVIVGILSVPIALATGLLTREVERRTLALLLSRLVSRIGIVASAALVCAIWPVFMCLSALAGTLAGVRIFGSPTVPDPKLLLHLATNLYLLTVAVSGGALAFAAWSSERSDAAGWTVTVVLIMYVWNFLAQIWSDFEKAGIYSLFHYYAPARILLRGSPSISDYQVLGLVACSGVFVAMIIYARRDFHV